jgi:hypothetical protein
MPRKLCLTPGCGGYAEVRGHCRPHATAQRKQNRSSFNSFYASKPWRLARRRQLYEHSICQICESAVAEHVHHRVKLTDGGAKTDPANLLSPLS